MWTTHTNQHLLVWGLKNLPEEETVQSATILCDKEIIRKSVRDGNKGSLFR